MSCPIWAKLVYRSFLNIQKFEVPYAPFASYAFDWCVNVIYSSQAHCLVEGTIWLIRRAGYSVEPVTPTAIAFPTVGRGLTTLSAIPASQVISSILGGALGVTMPSMASGDSQESPIAAD